MKYSTSVNNGTFHLNNDFLQQKLHNTNKITCHNVHCRTISTTAIQNTESNQLVELTRSSIAVDKNC